MQHRHKVAVVYRIVPQYREHFYELLRARLAGEGIDFMLIYGQPGASDASKRDAVEVPWACRIQNKIFHTGRHEIYWQPCLQYLNGVDLVVVEQASKLLINYLLLVQYALGIRRLAFWGHGKNFQVDQASAAAEWIKRLISTHVHWWFAYNDLSASIVQQIGFPAERITTVQNAIDTRQLASYRRRFTPEEASLLRHSLGIQSNNVGLFVGGMYPGKRLHFLLDACRLVRQSVPDFEMIFVGAGPEDALIRNASQELPWIHYAGPRFNEEKVPYFALSKVLLIPGIVGLVILDAFALDVPLVTTDYPSHSPEIDYLIPGRNGMMVKDCDDPRAYANAVASLLTSDSKLKVLVDGCRKAREVYTIESMVDRFASGILDALHTQMSKHQPLKPTYT